MGRAKKDSASAAEDLGKERDMVRVTIDVRLRPLVIHYVLRQARDNVLATRLSHSNKIEKLADRQDRHLEKIQGKAKKGYR